MASSAPSTRANRCAGAKHHEPDAPAPHVAGVEIPNDSSGCAPRACTTAIAPRPAIEIAIDSFGGLATRLRRREQRRCEVAERGLGVAPGLAAIWRPT